MLVKIPLTDMSLKNGLDEVKEPKNRDNLLEREVCTGILKSANKKDETVRFVLWKSTKINIKWKDYENGEITYENGKVIELGRIDEFEPETSYSGEYLLFFNCAVEYLINIHFCILS